MNIQQSDLEFLQEKGITREQFENQLKSLKEGFPYLRIEAPATIGNGISEVTPEMEKVSTEIWDKYLKSKPKVVKMVPASGAASRMFKNLFAFLDGKKNTPSDDFMKTFFDEIENFAFFPALNITTVALYNKSVETLIKEKKYKDIVSALLLVDGLNYGHLPKALLQFHRAMGGSRTALEEHLAEGAQYAASKNGKVRLHFTVSAEHIDLINKKLEEVKSLLEHLYGVGYEISLSVQKPSTDTVAVDMQGEPVRENGKLLFRPGGHGALIENLNDIDADVIFIKNVDNVVPDVLRDSTIKYKKILGGVLVATKLKIDGYCKRLVKGQPSEDELAEMISFLRNKLCITHDDTDNMTPEQKAAYVFSKLNRPLRVAGMVKNEGEPGGGPFLTYNSDGTVSPQVLESTQINPENKKDMELLKNSTHFNPVDIVCATKDYQGRKYNLPDYVDKTTGFISQKSREGVEIKALELPGLWNGAMSDWNTIFIEVPADTFNPVKTVNDLLKKAHQA